MNSPVEVHRHLCKRLVVFLWIILLHTRSKYRSVTPDRLKIIYKYDCFLPLCEKENFIKFHQTTQMSYDVTHTNRHTGCSMRYRITVCNMTFSLYRRGPLVSSNSELILRHTFCRTSWMGDQLTVEPLPTQDKYRNILAYTNAQNCMDSSINIKLRNQTRMTLCGKPSQEI